MRALRILLVLVVVLGGLFLAVDRAAVWYAESEAEDRVTISGGGPATTEISIKGFPSSPSSPDRSWTGSTSTSPA